MSWLIFDPANCWLGEFSPVGCKLCKTAYETVQQVLKVNMHHCLLTYISQVVWGGQKNWSIKVQIWPLFRQMTSLKSATNLLGRRLRRFKIRRFYPYFSDCLLVFLLKLQYWKSKNTIILMVEGIFVASYPYGFTSHLYLPDNGHY